MHVLVTGVAGFIGNHVARALLERGDTVSGIDSLNAYYDPELKRRRISTLDGWLESGRFRFDAVDFADRDRLWDYARDAEFDRIVHLGAQPGVRYSIDHPETYIASNLVGHANVIELARRRESGHFVYASSSSVYGDRTDLPLRVEDRTDHPISLYAATKRSNELVSETYAHLYRLPATGLRFFTVYGPWGRPDMAVWSFTRDILEGRPLTLFNNGRMRRDFTYIDDIVAGVIAVLDSPPPDDGLVKAGGSAAPHRLYNIGNSRAEELRRMVAVLEQACGREAIIEHLPMQPGDVTETYADIGPLADDLGYAPATPIDVGLPRFVDWYRDHARQPAS